MKFTSLPDNYAPLDEGLVCNIDLGEVRPWVDVDIVDDSISGTVAVCRFTNVRTVAVDIAPYVRRLFDPQPVQNPSTGVFHDAGRVVSVHLEIGDIVSESRRFTSFVIDGLPRILSTMPFERTIAFGEYDELAVYAPEGAVLTVEAECGGATAAETYRVPPSEDISIFVLDTADFPADASAFTLRFEASGRTDEVRYRVVKRMPEAQRLAWTASSGAVEFYTFPTRRCEVLDVEKSRCCGMDGYCTTAVVGEMSAELVSDYEPVAVIGELEEILTARRVWTVDAVRCTAADVVSSSTVRHFDGRLNTVSVTLRSEKREERL